MKTVFSGSMVAHTWAQLSQPYGRNAGNSMHFDGAVLYSYSTPIAAFCPLKNGTYLDAAVLLSSDRHSNTTSGHQSDARNAVRYRSHVYAVPHIGYRGSWSASDAVAVNGPASDPKSWAPVHAANVAWFAQQYRDTVAAEMKARQWYGPALDGLLTYRQRIEEYSDAFKIPKRSRPKLPCEQHAQEIEARRAELDAKRSTPSYKAKLEAGRIKRAEKREAANEVEWAAREEQRQRWAREAAERNALALTRLPRWLAGETDQAPRGTDTAHLRVSRDGLKVQTSWGAEISIGEARAFAAFWARHRAEGWTRALGTLKIGAFPLSRIDATTGDCEIGCHRITGAEIERVAALVGADQVPT